MNSVIDIKILLLIGFPIQKSPDLNLFSGSPKLIAAYHVFHRLLTPRHPPYALSSFTIIRLLLCNCKRATDFSEGSKPSLYLVEVNGLEPMTSCVQSRRSPNLSYTPNAISDCGSQRTFIPKSEFIMVGLDRFELSTSRLSGVRSNQLSYRPFG